MQSFIPVTGMSGKFAPSHLKNEILAYAEDLDFSRGTLKPVRTDRFLSAQTGNTLYLDECCLKTFATCVNITTDPNGCERVFASGIPGYDYPVTATPDEFCAGTFWRLGWPCTLAAPSVSYASGAQSSRVAEPRSYVYTFTNKYGEESQPSAPSPVTVVDFSVDALISGFATLSPEYAVSYVNIYVSVAGLAHQVGSGASGNDEYLKFATLEYGTLMFTHQPLVHTLSGALTTDEYVPVPDDATDIQWFGTSQLVFQSEGSIRFTEPWVSSLAPLKYTYTPRANLVRVIASEDFVYALTCSQPEALTAAQACDESGQRAMTVTHDKFPLIGRMSPAVWEKSVIYASTSGLVMLTGANAIVLTNDDIWTQNQYDSIQPHTMRGVVFDGYYYGATDTVTFRLEMPRGGKSGGAEKFSYLSIRPTAWFVTADNRLIYSDATGTHELGQGPDYKEYTAVTREIREHGQTVHSTFRIEQEPGETQVLQTVTPQSGIPGTVAKTLNKSGTYRLPRRMGNAVQYTIKSKSEVTALVVGNSVHNVVGKS